MIEIMLTVNSRAKNTDTNRSKRPIVRITSQIADSFSILEPLDF